MRRGARLLSRPGWRSRMQGRPLPVGEDICRLKPGGPMVMDSSAGFPGTVVCVLALRLPRPYIPSGSEEG